MENRITVWLKFALIILLGIFTLQTQACTQDSLSTVTQTSEIKFRAKKELSPLLILDGKIIDSQAMSKIDPNTIEKIEVIKEEEATKIYGEQAKDGAIIITTKKN